MEEKIKKEDKMGKKEMDDFEREAREYFGEEKVELNRKRLLPHIKDKRFRKRLADVIEKFAEKEKDKRETMKKMAEFLRGDHLTSIVGTLAVMLTFEEELVEKIVEEVEKEVE